MSYHNRPAPRSRKLALISFTFLLLVVLCATVAGAHNLSSKKDAASAPRKGGEGGGEGAKEAGKEGGKDAGEGTGKTLELTKKSQNLKIGEPICASTNSSCILSLPPVICVGYECAQNFTILIFPLFALFLGIIGKPFARLSAYIPYTLILLLAGVILGLLGCQFGLGLLGHSLQQWVHLTPPNSFFFVFLAPLIFEASFNTDYHVFRKLLMPILVAAFLIVIAQVFLIALFQLFIIRTPNWTSWWPALMFGAMLSATDPISVTATLKSVGASEYLNVLIEGESLLNDGSAFVLWEGFFENTIKEEEGHELLSPGALFINVIRLSVGGVGLGLLFGLAALIILTLVYDEYEIETSVTVVVAFLGFWTAQAPAKLSGVICNVTSGLLLSALGKNLISSTVRGPLHHLWEVLAWAANTIVFVHAGVLVSAFTWSCAGSPHTGKDYLFILVYYLYLQLIRVGLFYISYPLIKLKQDWMTWKEIMIVGLSGLRGAVSLVLALEVGLNPIIEHDIRSRIVLWSTCIVALSLLINGLIIKPSLTIFGLDRADRTREAFLRRARSLMLQKTLTILDSLCIDQAFKAVRWSYVRDNVLPHTWLNIANTGSYETALSHFEHGKMDIHSLDPEVRRSVDQIAISRRVSLAHPLTSPPRSPSVSFVHGSGARSPHGERVRPSFGPVGAAFDNDNFRLGADMQDAVGPRMTEDGDFMRQSIQQRYSLAMETGKALRTESEVLKEVRAWRKRKDAGEIVQEGPMEVEVRRRFLTSALSHLRSLANATFLQYSAFLDIQEDFQNALDANDNNRRYDLFEFLEKPGWKGFVERCYRSAAEAGGLKGETAIVTAHIIVAILTQVLKEPFLKQSPIIFAEVEQEYEWASAMLNRLEAINPKGFSWVEASFAVHLTYRRQDAVLHSLVQSGAIDEEEHHTIYEELAEVRRHYTLWASRRWKRPPLTSNEAKIRKAPMFAELTDEEYLKLVRRPGKISHMQAGDRLPASEGALVFVLEGAVRAGTCCAMPRTKTEADTLEDTEGKRRQTGETLDDDDYLSDDYGDAAVGGRRAVSFQLEGFRAHARPRLSLQAGYNYAMHWCFPEHNAFCGAEISVAIDYVCSRDLSMLPRTVDFYCCEVASRATVFWLPIQQMQKIVRVDENFRDEIARMIGREIVLESISDEPPYALSHISAAAARNEDSVILRATQALERLPYMNVLKLRAGERHVVHGPGILLHGAVRVSVMDTSGLIGAANLLHERLTGPALLPMGGLIIDEVQDGSEGEDEHVDYTVKEESGEPKKKEGSEGDIMAYVLAEEVTDLNRVASLRLKRWTAEGPTVDMNGRFGAYRHIDLEAIEPRPSRRTSITAAVRGLMTKSSPKRRSMNE